MKDTSRRWWAMAAISVSVLVVGLDLTVLSLALPTMAASLHATTGDLQWITDSYTLVIAALILPAGLLGDRYGRKKVMLAALIVFVGTSVWCAYSVSVGELIAARAVLGATPLGSGIRLLPLVGGMPPAAAAAVRGSVAGGVAVARKLGSVPLLADVRTAFIHGMDLMLWTCGGIALASALLALAFLPRRSGPPRPEAAGSPDRDRAQLET